LRSNDDEIRERRVAILRMNVKWERANEQQCNNCEDYFEFVEFHRWIFFP
jgi:hypothetical protein